MKKKSKVFDIIVLAGIAVNILLAVFLILFYFDFILSSPGLPLQLFPDFAPETAQRNPIVSSRKSGTILLRLVMRISAPVVV